VFIRRIRTIRGLFGKKETGASRRALLLLTSKKIFTPEKILHRFAQTLRLS
jgi:hypothetical protein